MVSHWQESTIEFGHAVDSWFRHFTSCFWYCKKTWNRAKNHFWGALNTSPPPKFHSLPSTRDFSRKRVCGFSNWRLQENVFNRVNLFGGAIFMFPPFNPQNPVSSWQEIVFGVTYVLSVQYSCAVVSVFWLCTRK